MGPPNCKYFQWTAGQSGEECRPADVCIPDMVVQIYKVGGIKSVQTQWLKVKCDGNGVITTYESNAKCDSDDVLNTYGPGTQPDNQRYDITVQCSALSVCQKPDDYFTYRQAIVASADQNCDSIDLDETYTDDEGEFKKYARKLEWTHCITLLGGTQDVSWSCAEGKKTLTRFPVQTDVGSPSLCESARTLITSQGLPDQQKEMGVRQDAPDENGCGVKPTDHSKLIKLELGSECGALTHSTEVQGGEIYNAKPVSSSSGVSTLVLALSIGGGVLFCVLVLLAIGGCIYWKRSQGERNNDVGDLEQANVQENQELVPSEDVESSMNEVDGK